MNYNLHRLIKKDRSFGLVNITPEIKPTILSKDKDPRVKKLISELQKIDITPKPKYINLNFK
jgi:hypothetical protein